MAQHLVELGGMLKIDFCWVLLDTRYYSIYDF